MEESPEVAIIQYVSGVMNVTSSFFESAISNFTRLVYTQIKFAVANGDVAPFVGHNAVLRWSAIQSIGYDCELDNREKFWSEDTVSEDFDIALRLQGLGWVLRLGAYTGEGFQEGVSLTVYDELARCMFPTPIQSHSCRTDTNDRGKICLRLLRTPLLPDQRLVEYGHHHASLQAIPA